MTDDQLPHGFTLTELDTTAAKAAHTSPWRQIAFRQRVDISQFAILELLYAADDRPDFWALVKAGQRAIHTYAVKELHHRGLVARTGAPGGVPITRYWTYWQAIATATESYEDRIIDAIAVRQIISTLRYPHLQVIRALADYDDYTLAAESLGKARHGFVTTLCTARQLCLQLWHEHETPSRIWGHDHRSARTRRDRTTSKSITVTTVRRRRADRRRATQPDRDLRPPKANPANSDGDM
ncbi:hypothetical protein [Virgisporangium aurantiacum]|uniref:Uncharacterized protein n=1 Tax=Virgisporangium aurantiacum TaxID=175570 RepID=A0A8J4E942_9ACTN|nr:hypothetical protein [Virgisporangium aurantiacum]GIJ63372.1 hypothetical protein Vau01_108880 [Virgisporangium aurantiacum]